MTTCERGVTAAMTDETDRNPLRVDAAGTTIACLIETWRRRDTPYEAFTAVDTSGSPVAEIIVSAPGAADALQEGRRVQERLLPRDLPVVPGFQFAGRYVPAGVVGGDYWSVKHYPERGIVTCKLADVTGHGIGAAILMAAVKFVSGVLFRYSRSPATVMERTNHSLLHETNPDKMATMVYAWLYVESHRVRLVNAGHAPAFLCHPDGSIEDLPATGPLLGLMETEYEEISFPLQTGDVLFFCSDGITEAGAPDTFGEDRVKDLVRDCRQRSAEEIADAVLDAVRGYCRAPRDDMSLLIIKAVPKGKVAAR